jgi:hemerythrin-like domain-containing protein
MVDIHDLLERDHKAVRERFSTMGLIEPGGYEEEALLFADIRALLEPHMAFEEEVFYPAAAKATGLTWKVEDSIREHDEARSMIAEIGSMDPRGNAWKSRTIDLAAALDRHIREEEETLFPQSRSALSIKEKEEMASQYAAFLRRHGGIPAEGAAPGPA